MIFGIASRISALVLPSLILLAGSAEAGFVLTAEAAGVQQSQVSGVTTETFDSIKKGNYTSLPTAIGSISSPSIAIVKADTYGGAGGKGNYAAIGAQSGSTSATLTLNGPAAYFGFWWSAADNQNQVQFLANGQVVATFNTATVNSALGNVFFKNPNDDSDGGEKFAYLNLYATGGSVIDQVRFSNLNTGTGFESDNWSVRTNAVSTPFSGTVIPGGVTGVVPEPSSLAMVACGAVGLAGFGYRRSR